MKNESLIKIAATMVLILSVLAGGCSSGPVTEQQIVAPVQRGDMAVVVHSMGNIDMPEAVNLYFDTSVFGAASSYSSRIKAVYVHRGDFVYAGAILAQLDDTVQKQTVETAQYALEAAINNVVQTGCCGAGRYPTFYADEVALLRYEFALKETAQAKADLSTGENTDAAEQLALAKADIEGAKTYYTNPDYKDVRTQYDQLDRAVETSEDYGIAIDRFTSEVSSVAGIQDQIKNGQYSDALLAVQDVLSRMDDTHTVVKRITHLPGGVSYPDYPSAYTVVHELVNSLSVLQQMSDSEKFDPVKFSEQLSMVRHDMELSTKILEENITFDRLGVNLKVLRDYNINMRVAIINLEHAKEVLLKTELIAPFDGRVVDVNLQTGDMISQRYSVTGLPIDSYVVRMVNTSNVRMVGQVNDLDVTKVKQGQAADVYVDALPGKVLKGKVSFISPYGSGLYRLEISLDPADAQYLAQGQAAEADVLIDRHTGVLMVPNSAVMGKAGAYYVRVLVDQKANLVEQRPVATGLQNDSMTEIVSGIQESEKVVLQRAGPTSMPRK